MDWWAKTNYNVNKLAKRFLKQCLNENREQRSRRLWFEKWALYIDNRKMTSFNPKDVYEALFRHKTFRYWRKHDQFKLRHPTKVDWEPCRLATSRMSKGL